MRKVVLTCTLMVLLVTTNAISQDYRPGLIRQKLEKLNVLGSVLYVAAHPDDENTRLITYYANDKLMRTAYLSATRGDGGQNLIGPEIREALGIIRTQELLAARSVDGGRQFFSRANDFGYSKNPNETFNIWDREQVLADFVWVFRKFKPDVVITRFNSEGVNHGHHTASAILAKEAFEMANDPTVFPEQLAYVDPWNPSKIFWNTGWWWLRRSPGDTVGLSKINMGEFNPLLGSSYGEIAARSRSMHKSQGFGSAGRRGIQIEYLKQWGGSKSENPFDDINTTWDRVEGSEEVQFYVNKAISEFDERSPWKIAEPLALARKALNNLNEPFWKEVKLKELDELILLVSGLYISLSADSDTYAPGDSIKIDLEVVNRSETDISLKEIHFNEWINPVPFETKLLRNRPFNTSMNFLLSEEMPYSTPYWLRNPSGLGMYHVDEQELIGNPENKPALFGTILLDVGGEEIALESPVLFKRTDPVDGEVTLPISIGPPVMVNMDDGVLVFGDGQSKSIDVKVMAGRQGIEGVLKLDLPKGWKSEPKEQAIALARKGEERVFTFSVIPPSGSSTGDLQAVATIDDQSYRTSRVLIDYDHIPRQITYPEAMVKLVRVDLKKEGESIGYIEGAGDAIPENLRQVGYQVVKLSKDEVEVDNLMKYDAVILGVRAFNTVDWLSYKNKQLFEYVKNGGNLIVQYNTSHRLVTKEVSPYDLKLSRDRVTVEEAPIEVLDASHPVMNKPNTITEQDFEGWVQERGLYFPNEWGEEFTPILSSNDPGESPKKGGLLVAKYGKGYYIYSGYSWFRELPAGVPGAYRIFVNMISLGK